MLVILSGILTGIGRAKTCTFLCSLDDIVKCLVDPEYGTLALAFTFLIVGLT